MPSSDVITLQNLEEKLPRWHPVSESHLYAIVDMGRLVKCSFFFPPCVRM